MYCYGFKLNDVGKKMADINCNRCFMRKLISYDAAIWLTLKICLKITMTVFGKQKFCGKVWVYKQ